jgi:hypothetical protein
VKRKTRAQRRAVRRAKVNREERSAPPPEAAQHHRPWPLQVLAHQGVIDSDEFEAAIELVETFRAITAELQAKGLSLGDPRGLYGGSGAMSDRAAFMSAVWFEWSFRVGPVATQLVEQIEDTTAIRSPVVLRLGLRRWLKVKDDLRRNRIDKPLHRVLT